MSVLMGSAWHLALDELLISPRPQLLVEAPVMVAPKLEVGLGTVFV